MWGIDSFTDAGDQSSDGFITAQLHDIHEINERAILCITTPLSTYYRFGSAIQLLLLYFDT